ncbi:Protein CBG25861 [Caenorhabditis briggsae]|uniref:Protein CBG25861 n=1 Tax=Caenorhabditis briggsae TaxID=6238 RepID=B6IIT8_CAEBR|nr:Protein CBG25861 [Caenorhabditis briggsae]CAR99818.1 Protein CBG25861 [Caenorhabditis briggsae]
MENSNIRNFENYHILKFENLKILKLGKLKFRNFLKIDNSELREFKSPKKNQKFKNLNRSKRTGVFELLFFLLPLQHFSIISAFPCFSFLFSASLFSYHTDNLLSHQSPTHF